MKKQRVDGVTPAVHLEFIQNQADLPEAEGAEQIEAYHRALFLHDHAGDIERFKQQERIHEERLAHLEQRLQDAHRRLGTMDKLVPVDFDGEADLAPTAPWNMWDRAMFTVAALGIVLLLTFGILNISFNLLESGLVTFVEHPVRAYFWAALLPVGALCVKLGWDFLQGRRARGVYLWVCLVVGIAGVLVWVAAYAAVYPTLSRTTAEQIQSLSVFDAVEGQTGTPGGMNSSGVKWIDATIVAAQALAEIFLSAVLGIFMTIIYARHRPVRLATNPQFAQFDEERAALEESVSRERLALAEARGNQARLENQLSALLAYARSLFHKEVAFRGDQSQKKRILLDKISEQLRDQLQSVDDNNGSPGNARMETAAVRTNGKL